MAEINMNGILTYTKPAKLNLWKNGRKVSFFIPKTRRLQHYFYQSLLTLATHLQGSGMTHVCSCVTECYRSLCKGALSGCKRWLFSVRFVAFYNAKGGLLEKQPRAGTYQTELRPDSGWVRPDVMRIFSASAKACRPWLSSMPHRGGEHEAIRQQNHKKRHSGCLSIQKPWKYYITLTLYRREIKTFSLNRKSAFL